MVLGQDWPQEKYENWGAEVSSSHAPLKASVRTQVPLHPGCRLLAHFVAKRQQPSLQLLQREQDLFPQILSLGPDAALSANPFIIKVKGGE